MSKFRFVAIGTDRIEQKPRLGPAIYLHEFLVDHQTDALGHVFYGKAIGYAWIRSRWANCPSTPTLKRYMARLRKLGKVYVTVLPFGQGMRIRLLDSVKWSTPVSEPAIQLPLFAPALASISSGKVADKPVSKQRKTGMASELPVGSKVIPVGDQNRSRNEVKKLIEETIKSKTLAPQAVQTEEQLQARRALLKQQAEFIEKKYKTS